MEPELSHWDGGDRVSAAAIARHIRYQKLRRGGRPASSPPMNRGSPQDGFDEKPKSEGVFSSSSLPDELYQQREAVLESPAALVHVAGPVSAAFPVSASVTIAAAPVATAATATATTVSAAASASAAAATAEAPALLFVLLVAHVQCGACAVKWLLALVELSVLADVQAHVSSD